MPIKSRYRRGLSGTGTATRGMVPATMEQFVEGLRKAKYNENPDYYDLLEKMPASIEKWKGICKVE